MKKVINSDRYGKILYEESFWTGRKRISINDKIMKSTSKNTFELIKDDYPINALIIGNAFSGMKLKVVLE